MSVAFLPFVFSLLRIYNNKTAAFHNITNFNISKSGLFSCHNKLLREKLFVSNRSVSHLIQILLRVQDIKKCGSLLQHSPDFFQALNCILPKINRINRSYSRKRNKDLSNYCIFMAWKNMINYALYRKLENEVFNKYILHYTDKMCWPYK